MDQLSGDVVGAPAGQRPRDIAEVPALGQLLDGLAELCNRQLPIIVGPVEWVGEGLRKSGLLARYGSQVGKRKKMLKRIYNIIIIYIVKVRLT